MIQGVVRLGLFEAMKEEVDSLCGRRYQPDPHSDCQRAGSERGVAYLDGEKESVIRPRVRSKEGSEVRLATYEAASSPKGMFDQVIAQRLDGANAVRTVESWS